MNDREEMFILRDNTLVKLSRERLFFDRMCEMTERKKNGCIQFERLSVHIWKNMNRQKETHTR